MRQFILGLLCCGCFQLALANTEDQLQLLDILGISSFIEQGSESEAALLDSLEKELAPELLDKALELLSSEAFLSLLEKELQASKETAQQQAYGLKLEVNKLNPDRLDLITQLVAANQFLALLQAAGISSLDEKQLLHFYLYCYRYTPSEKISLQIKRYQAPEVQAVLLVLQDALQAITIPNKADIEAS